MPSAEAAAKLAPAGVFKLRVSVPLPLICTEPKPSWDAVPAVMKLVLATPASAGALRLCALLPYRASWVCTETAPRTTWTLRVWPASPV